MGARKIKTLVCGNSIAALVCGERLLAAGEEVLVLSPDDYPGGHFRGVVCDGVPYDVGMNFFEFTSYRDDPAASLESYDPRVKNDSGRFVSHVRRYLEEELGVETVRCETPRLYHAGRWYDDFIISDRLCSLAELPSTLRDRLARNLQELTTPPALHARYKNRSPAFRQAGLEQVSRANHGDVFHEEFIEPLCRKITNSGSGRLLAYYHRLAWLPVFWPETLKSCFSGKPQPLPEVQFHYPASGRMADLIDVLTGRLRRGKALETAAFAAGGLKLPDPVEVTLGSGEVIHPENLVWAGDWTKLARIQGRAPQPFDMANISCAFFETDSGHLQTPFSTAFIVDAAIPCYRITQFDHCAGKTSGAVRLCMEFNTDRLGEVGSLERCWKMLVDLGVVEQGAPTAKGRLQHFHRALLLPTPGNYGLHADLEKSLSGHKPAMVALAGSSGFSSTSFNDQVVQGMKAAAAIRRGANDHVARATGPGGTFTMSRGTGAAADKLDRIAEAYHGSVKIPDKFIEDLQQDFSGEIMKKHLDFAGREVLELGYGEGIVSEFLRKQSCRLTIVEGAKRLVREARARGFHVEDSLFEDYDPGKPYDLVLANHVLEHVDDPRRVLERMRGWLKPQGKIFAIVPNRESLHRHVGLAMGLQEGLEDLSPRDHLVGHQRVYSLGELEADFRESGFEVLHRGGYFLKFFANAAMLEFSPELIQGFNDLSQDFPPELCANIFIVARPH